VGGVGVFVFEWGGGGGCFFGGVVLGGGCLGGVLGGWVWGCLGDVGVVRERGRRKKKRMPEGRLNCQKEGRKYPWGPERAQTN